MAFNASAFTIAGTAIAIAGVGLYLWDTRKEKVMNAYNQYAPIGNNQGPQIAGSRRHKKKKHKKTRKH